MKTLKSLQAELKEALSGCNYPNDGSLAARVNEKIQWAWDNWDIDFSPYHAGGQKPAGYTSKFRDEWIDNEDFDAELESL